MRFRSRQATWTIASRPSAATAAARTSGAEHRVAAGVVGDAQRVDPRIVAEVAGQLPHPGAGQVGEAPAPRDELGDDREPAAIRDGVAQAASS